MIEGAVANSLGIAATSRRTACSLTVSAVVGEGDGTQTGYGFSVGRVPEDLDPEFAVDEAVLRAVRLLGAAPVPSARMPIVLDPLVARSFIGLLGTPLSGESLAKG